jgi:hypothetical protein
MEENYLNYFRNKSFGKKMTNLKPYKVDNFITPTMASLKTDLNKTFQATDYRNQINNRGMTKTTLMPKKLVSLAPDFL